MEEVRLLFIYLVLAIGIFFMYFFNKRFMSEPSGNDKVKKISRLIQKGSEQFLKIEFIYITVFVI